MTYLYSSINELNDLYVLKLGSISSSESPIVHSPREMCCRKRLAKISTPQQTAASCFLRISVGSMRQQQIRPPQKMESNNKKRCRVAAFNGGFWHKYTQSQSVWHLQIILAFGGIFVPGWLDLKTWEQWQHCCFACVLRCQLFLLQLLIHLRKVVEFDTRGFLWDQWQTNWLQYLYHIDYCRPAVLLERLLTKHMMRLRGIIVS